MNHSNKQSSRRGVMTAGLGLATAALTMAQSAEAAPDVSPRPSGARTTRGSGTITTRDGVQIFYKDWGTGQPIVFHHGWP